MSILVIYRPCQTALQKALQIYIPIIKQCILHLCQTWILSTVQVLSIRLKKKMFLVDWVLAFLINDFAELVQHPALHLLVNCIGRVLFTLFWYMCCQYFLLVFGLPFHFLKDIFQRAKVLNFDEIQFINFFFIDHIFCVLRNFCPEEQSLSFFF